MRWLVLASAYAILWFLALQILLPIGIKSTEENGAVPPDLVDPAAPPNPRIALKFLLATLAAGILWSIFYALVLMKVVNI